MAHPENRSAPLRVFRLSRRAVAFLRYGAPVAGVAILLLAGAGTDPIAALAAVPFWLLYAVPFILWSRNRIELYSDRVVIVRALKSYSIPLADISRKLVVGLAWRDRAFTGTSSSVPWRGRQLGHELSQGTAVVPRRRLRGQGGSCPGRCGRSARNPHQGSRACRPSLAPSPLRRLGNDSPVASRDAQRLPGSADHPR